MVEYGHISPKTYFLTEDGRTIKFELFRHNGNEKPKPEECKGAIKGIHLSYAFCGEQDFGITPMAKRFGATDENGGTITKIPKELEIVESEGIKALKFGSYINIDPVLIKATKEAGIIGYWEDTCFIICATPEYEFIINSIRKMFKKNHVKFALNRSFAGPNFLILAI